VTSNDLNSSATDNVTISAGLLIQHDRSGWVGDLVRAAKVDSKFPRANEVSSILGRLIVSITHATFRSRKLGTQ